MQAGIPHGTVVRVEVEECNFHPVLHDWVIKYSMPAALNRPPASVHLDIQAYIKDSLLSFRKRHTDCVTIVTPVGFNVYGKSEIIRVKHITVTFIFF